MRQKYNTGNLLHLQHTLSRIYTKAFTNQIIQSYMSSVYIILVKVSRMKKWCKLLCFHLMQLLNGTLMATVMETPIPNCIGINLIGIFLVPILISIAKSSSVDFYNLLYNKISGQYQSVPTAERRDWRNVSHPNCCHFGWSLLSRLTIQYWECDLLIISYFLSLFEGIMSRNF